MGWILVAQETIRLNCIESVYLGEDKPDGNYGKTSELKLEHQNTSREHLKYFTILKFDIPEKVKKHKILSCKLNFNATVYATEDPFLQRRETHFNFFSLKKEFQTLANNIYTAKYQDIAYPSGRAHIQVGQKTNNDYNGLMLKQNYPVYTNFSMNYLGLKGTSEYFTVNAFWNEFINFLDNGVAFVLAECDTTSVGQYTRVTMQSNRTSSPPYMEVVIDTDYLYIATDKTGFVDPSRDFTFRWSIGSTLHLYNPMTEQISAKFRIKKIDGAQKEIDIAGANYTYLVPAKTLESGDYEWQVFVTTDDGRSATTEWQQFTTKDALSRVTNLYPNLITLDGSQENIFRWNHLISTNSKPHGFEIQYRNENTAWKILVDNQNTDDAFYVVSANTLPVGNLEWRVRTYNSNLIAGKWSETSSIIVRSAPTTPIITSVTTNPRPTIVWQAEGQVQAEIKVGEKIQSVLSASKSYRWAEFLPDGSATVSVRVKNRFNLWSKWAQAQVMIQNHPTGQVEVLADVENFSAVVSAKSQFPANYLYRDGELIGKMKAIKEAEGTYKYIDDTALGTHTYYVLGVDAESNYQRSKELKASVQVPFGIISERGTQNWVELKKRRGAFPMHTIAKKCPVSMVYYAGKSLPVAHVADELGVSHTLEFTTDKQTTDRVEDLVGKNIIYKDVRGDSIEGILASVECNRDRMTDIKIEIRETQQEVILIE